MWWKGFDKTTVIYISFKPLNGILDQNILLNIQIYIDRCLNTGLNKIW